MTKVAIHQPNFLPWRGYFYKMKMVDIFVILDDVQYTKNSYINRTKINTSMGPQWLTVPVHFKSGQKINEICISHKKFFDKSKKNIGQNYVKADNFSIFSKELYSIFDKQPDKLIDLNLELLKFLACFLKIQTKIVLSSDLKIQSTGDDRLIDIIQAVSGSSYLSGRGGKKYQVENKFNQANIKLLYTDFIEKPYNQLWTKEFIPGLSIIDRVFTYNEENEGANIL